MGGWRITFVLDIFLSTLKSELFCGMFLEFVFSQDHTYTTVYCMVLDARKPVFGVFDKVRLYPGSQLQRLARK